MKKLLVIGLVFVIAFTVALSVVTAGCGGDDATDDTTVEQTDTTMDDTATTLEDSESTEDVTTTVAE